MRCRWLLVAIALLLPGTPSSSEERSTTRLKMISVLPGARAKLRWDFTTAGALLDVRPRGLAANQEYFLKISSGVITSFVTDARGNADLLLDLAETGGGIAPTYDPRGLGTEITNAPYFGQQSLVALVLDIPQNDSPKSRHTEVTSLAAEPGVTGTATSVFRRLAAGGDRLVVSFAGVAPGDLELRVSGVAVAAVTIDSRGEARIALSTRATLARGGAGTGRPESFEGPLPSGSRLAHLEVWRGGSLEFSGSSLAQIPGLNTCTPSARPAALTLDPSFPSGSGRVVLGFEANCDVHHTMELIGVPAGSYFWTVVGGVGGGPSFVVPDEGAGIGSITIEYEEDPDPGEGTPNPEIASGRMIEVYRVDAGVGSLAFTGFLP